MRTRVYYNEHDPAACDWLRELMKKGMIPEGDIDERSIVDVKPDDLGGYTQCHFFAGIGGWAYALRLAGVPDLGCWTGSCPCQPFSAAGKRRGTDDERHLWPDFLRLIAERRPRLVFGEQVEAAVDHGWLDLVSSGLEAEGYAVGSVVMGAHSVGGVHIRQRLYWVADSGRTGERHDARAVGSTERQAKGRQPQPACEAKNAVHSGAACGVGDAQHDGSLEIRKRGETEEAGRLHGPEGPSDPLGDAGTADAEIGLGHRDGVRQLQGEIWNEPLKGAGELAAGQPSAVGGMADSDCGGLEGSSACSGEGQGADALREGALGGFWSECDWLPCRDGKARPTEPGTFPLAHGVPQRVVLLKGYGNAVVPQVAAAFVKALIG